MFEHQTIAELASLVSEEQVPASDQGPIEGDVPLTPIQRWFFDVDQPNPNHSNQAVLLEFRENVSADVLECAINHLISHHDALRMRFVRESTGWRQRNEVAIPRIRLRRIDLSSLQSSTRAAALKVAAAEAQSSLDLCSGPLMRAVLFEFGRDQGQRLLWVVHHLVVDAVSWRILLDDLSSVYRQLERGESAAFPPKGTSYQDWSRQLVAYSNSEGGREEAEYWLSLPWSETRPFPRDHEDGPNSMASERFVVRRLGRDQTHALSHEVKAAFRVGMNNVLLTVLAQAVALWKGDYTVLVDLEGHGREEALVPVDVSRTVGCFTSIWPVLLDLRAARESEDVVTVVKEQLRRVPYRGAGYSALKYLGPFPEFSSCIQAEISFNYLGRLDQDLADGSWFRLSTDDVGPLHDPAGMRRYLLGVSSSVVEGCLNIRVAYSENVHKSTTIERLTDDMLVHLRTLISRSRDCEGTFTSGDFPLIEIIPPTATQRRRAKE